MAKKRPGDSIEFMMKCPHGLKCCRSGNVKDGHCSGCSKVCY